MEVYELLARIRKTPVLFIGGDRRLSVLHAFLSGYEYGSAESVFGELRPFNDWVAQRLGITMRASKSWREMIATSAVSDESAYELFFELFEQYMEERGRRPGTPAGFGNGLPPQDPDGPS